MLSSIQRVILAVLVAIGILKCAGHPGSLGC